MDTRQHMLSGLTVLVIEDEAFIAFALKSYLEEAGASDVDTAATLAQATGKLAEKQFDVAIVDVRLPDGEAYDLAASLVAQKMPVVIHSGHATSERNKQLSGAVFCAKPATPDEILGAVEAALAA